MQPDLLQLRPPAPVAAPTVEPTPDKFRRAPGDPRDYRAEWDAFVAARPDVAEWIAQTAKVDASLGHRVEVNALFALARAKFRCTLNNSWRAGAADHLIERHPELRDAITRRERKRTAAKAVAP